MTSTGEKTGVNQRQKERYCFIEYQLYWNGSLNRTDLAEEFGMSESQATMDIKAYQALAPNNLQYDLGKKSYLPSKEFAPQFEALNPQKYLNQLIGDESGDLLPTETLPSFIRSISPSILRTILAAMRNKEKLCISYQSPRRPEKTERWVYPLAFVFTAGRWHLRTYCHLREEFRSFVLGRIISIDDVLSEESDIPEDTEWNSYVTVKIVPSKKLCECAKSIIEQDYKMEQGIAKISVRKALLKYFLLENQLLGTKFAELDDESTLIRDNGMISVKNYKEIEGFLV